MEEGASGYWGEEPSRRLFLLESVGEADPSRQASRRSDGREGTAEPAVPATGSRRRRCVLRRVEDPRRDEQIKGAALAEDAVDLQRQPQFLDESLDDGQAD